MRRLLLLVALVGCSYDFAGGASDDDGAPGGADGTTAAASSASGTGASSGGPASTAAQSGSGSVTTATSAESVASSSSTGQPDPVVPTCGQSDDFAGGLDDARWDWSAESNGSVTPENGAVKMRAGNGPNEYAGITAKLSSPTECAFTVRLVTGEASVSAHQSNANYTALAYDNGSFGGYSGSNGNFHTSPAAITPTHLGLVFRSGQILGMARDDAAGWYVVFEVDAPDWDGDYRPTAYVYGNNQEGVIDDYGVSPIHESDLQ